MRVSLLKEQFSERVTKGPSGQSYPKFCASSKSSYQCFVKEKKKIAAFLSDLEICPNLMQADRFSATQNYFASSVNCGVCLFINTMDTLLSAPLPSDTQN